MLQSRFTARAAMLLEREAAGRKLQPGRVTWVGVHNRYPADWDIVYCTTPYRRGDYGKQLRDLYGLELLGPGYFQVQLLCCYSVVCTVVHRGPCHC